MGTDDQEINQSINNLVGTFATVNTGDYTEIPTNNLVCIDTSNNRIGINTINPRYSIDVSGQGGTIFSNNLLINNEIRLVNPNKFIVDNNQLAGLTEVKKLYIDLNTGVLKIKTT